MPRPQPVWSPGLQGGTECWPEGAGVMCSGALDKDLLFARAGGGVAFSRVQGQNIKRPEASYQCPVGLTVQLAGREINADHCVLGPPLATALAWISQSFTLLGLRRLCADSDFLRVSRRLVPQGPKTQVGRTEHTSVHSPIYKEPDEDGVACGLGTTLAEAGRTPRCWSWGLARAAAI